jgi:hypothetical protein
VRVSLFITCFYDTLFPQTGRAVVKLLERLGCDVDFPLEQTCCGQMHTNPGYPLEGMDLARRFARVFDRADSVVTPSASCAGMLRHHLAADERPPVYELSEFLVDVLRQEDVGAHYPHRVAYGPSVVPIDAPSADRDQVLNMGGGAQDQLESALGCTCEEAFVVLTGRVVRGLIEDSAANMPRNVARGPSL